MELLTFLLNYSQNGTPAQATVKFEQTNGSYSVTLTKENEEAVVIRLTPTATAGEINIEVSQGANLASNFILPKRVLSSLAIALEESLA